MKSETTAAVSALPLPPMMREFDGFHVSIMHQRFASGKRNRIKGLSLMQISCRMDAITAFGLFAVSAMLVCYALESRSHWFVLLFAVSCALGSDYGFLQGAWPFGLVEAIWSAVALRRWLTARKC
jgi:hypothetical protein